MDLDAKKWRQRFEEADRERRELTDALDAIRCGQVDTILASGGGSPLLSVLDTKLVEENRRLAEIDTLTGLTSRYRFEAGIIDALPLAGRQGKSLALVMLDLDKFKNVNDTLGHAAGDQLLIEVARRLRSQVRDGDLLCRLGGDEFAILVHNLDNISLARLLSHRILTALVKPLVIDGCDIVISASIGIASYPDCATDVIQLMKCADIAMYRSKEGGRNQTHFYSEAMHEQVQKRVELERELHQALERNEFVLYYQPQVDAETEQIIGAEALIRWQHPSKGLIPPDDFIPIAEEIGAINKIGIWVLETACAQFQQWRERYNTIDLNLSIAVNLSALQLGQQDFIQRIEDILTRYQVPPECLELELTESAISKSSEATRLLQELSERGISLALDDFGTGYSSLLQLQKYPFKVLKIDKSFIQSISDNEDDARFLQAINAFAKTLDLQVVAEGVETQTQKAWCQKLKFDRIQGYYFSKPVPASEFEVLLRDARATLAHVVCYPR
ncbi:MAG: EAL domain-containing protein [Pseudomonadales bacterium]